MSNNIRVLLVGAGYMGKEYAKILSVLNIDFDVVTRSEKTAESFVNEIGIMPYIGYLDQIEGIRGRYSHAINAVSVNELSNVTIKLLNLGIKNILVEKPVGINYESVKKVFERAKKTNANVFVGYNRRYYSSTKKAQEIINDDGGLLSVNFEFTEWKSKIDFSKYPKDVVEKWLIANSTHVIDLAFYFAGEPEKFHFYSGRNSESPKDIFVGSGITTKGVYFNYSANWDAPGRWGVELLTHKHRLILRPMEELYIQDLSSIEVSKLEVDYSLDKLYKAGLYSQTLDFISKGPTKRLKSVGEQLNSISVYEEILDGGCSKFE